MLLIVCNQKKSWSILSVISTTYTGSKDDKGIPPKTAGHRVKSTEFTNSN
jgi:hypothetical protein